MQSTTSPKPENVVPIRPPALQLSRQIRSAHSSAMKVPVSGHWLPSKWTDALPVITSHAATIIVLIIALALIFSGIMHSGLSSNSGFSNSITPEGRQYLHELSEKASKIAKDAENLNSSATSISRIKSHRSACAAIGGGNCSCNEVAYSFAEFERVETKLLTPGNIKIGGVKTIHRVNPDTSQGLENIRGLVLDPRSSAADTLETVVSIGDLVPGQD